MRDSPLNGLGRAVGVNLSSLESGLAFEGLLGGTLRRIAYWYRQPTPQQKLRVGRNLIEGVLAQGGLAPRDAGAR